MEIRSSQPSDKPAIIEILRQSLGESTIPKSEALWNWKHEENPFGSSFVLLATENETLIGLRAFMQWQWKWNDKTYRAIRAVDTATHPQHQGKGIFKKLTLQQAQLCKEEGIDFVFNTPNEQSRPGYLKMGWVAQGRMPLKFKIRNAPGLVISKLLNKDKYSKAEIDPTPVQEWNINSITPGTKYYNNTKELTTILTPEYISWRYARNPLFRYNYFTDNETFLAICRIKNHGFARELRIVDFVLLKPDVRPGAVNSALKKAAFAYCREQGINILSLSGRQYQLNQDYFRWMGVIPVRNAGPIVTVKDLNMNDRFPSLLDVANWGYSLGDMELF